MEKSYIVPLASLSMPNFLLPDRRFKGIVHTNYNFVIVFSPPCHSDPVLQLVKAVVTCNSSFGPLDSSEISGDPSGRLPALVNLLSPTMWIRAWKYMDYHGYLWKYLAFTHTLRSATASQIPERNLRSFQ